MDKLSPSSPLSLFILSLCVLLSSSSLSCSYKPTDMRSLVPGETLVYLETNDLAAALQPIVDSKPFTEVAKKKPDFSALKGVQLAVAVTGFETSEEKLTDEHSVGKIQPHFVAVADTHAWNYQAVKFAELKLGSFIERIYDSEPTLEKSDKNGGKYFTWTASAKEGGGRKAYALVIDSLIYFGNDETAIEKCLAVRRGELDSIAKTGKVQAASQETLASGYVSTDGIAQIANIAGMKFASQSSDDSEVQSAIAGILPQLIRGSITDITWTASLTNEGIEDKYKVGMPPEIASVFSETMAPTGAVLNEFAFSLNDDVHSATKYDLRNPAAAWESVVQIAKKSGGAFAEQIARIIGPAFFEAYGIKDNEVFLRSVGPIIITAAGGNDDEKHLVVAQVKDAEALGKSLVGPLKKQKKEVGDGVVEFLTSDDNEFAAQFYDAEIRFGNRDLFMRNGRDALSLKDKLTSVSLSRNPASIQTISNSAGVVDDICTLLSHCESHKQANSFSITETRFTKSGMERRTVSDFGLIGSIIAQLAQD